MPGAIEGLLSAHLPEIYRILAAAYPEEGCGFVFEDESGALRVVSTVNRATRLHEMDPLTYPRDGRTYFEPDMKPWLRAVRDGQTARVIFHSHPDTDAYFSDTDKAQAVFGNAGGRLEERNPGVVHLVVSVRGVMPKAQVARLYKFSETGNDFERVATYDARGQLIEEGE